MFVRLFGYLFRVVFGEKRASVVGGLLILYNLVGLGLEVWFFKVKIILFLWRYMEVLVGEDKKRSGKDVFEIFLVYYFFSVKYF